MNIKSLIVGAALVALAGPAFAITNIGSISAPSTTSVSNDSAFTFTSTNATWIKITATDSNTADRLGTASYTLYDTTTSSTIGTGYFTFVPILSQWIGLMPRTGITAGDSFEFIYSGPAGAGRNVGYSVTTGVPELSTWGMMLAGFGALAFAGYRRRPHMA
jgi:hypothetical protein